MRRTVLLLALCTLGLAARASEGNLGRGHFDLARADIVAFVEQLAGEGLARERTLALLAAAEPQPKIIDAMSRPAEKTLQWWEYRARFVKNDRIDAGAALWREHRERSTRSRSSGRCHRSIVAILGVETLYGRQSGRRVLDALATLASTTRRAPSSSARSSASSSGCATRTHRPASALVFTPARWARRSSCPRATAISP
jgi:membrane-bound lytic murein transglycosylase B